MFLFTIANQLSIAVKELSTDFVLGSTNDYHAEIFIKAWERYAILFENPQAIRQELKANKQRAVGQIRNLQSYSEELDNILTHHCQVLEQLTDDYLRGDEWDYWPVLPEQKNEDMAVEPGVMPLFAQYVVKLNEAVVRLPAIIKQVIDIKIAEKKPDAKSQNSFSDLFISADELVMSINILRDVSTKNRKPVIDDDGKWIGKKGSISILIAWIEVLQERGRFNTNIGNTQIAELLNAHFPGLDLDTVDGSIWRKITAIRNKYHADFLHLIK